jgi:hypothetical protein
MMLSLLQMLLIWTLGGDDHDLTYEVVGGGGGSGELL